MAMNNRAGVMDLSVSDNESKEVGDFLFNILFGVVGGVLALGVFVWGIVFILTSIKP